MLDMKMDSNVDYFLCDGQGLFYFRPNGDSYQILYFPKESYRAYRDQAGELESVVLIYSFNVQQTNVLDSYPNQNGRGGKKKWIQLKVYKDRIEQTISDEKIEFDNQQGMMPFKMPGATETLVNTLGYIPAVEVFNHMDCTGEANGTGEFDWLSHQIMYHDELVRNVRKNMKFFGNPTLVHSVLSTTSLKVVMRIIRPTISPSWFCCSGRSSTRVSQPFGGSIDGYQGASGHCKPRAN